MATLTSQPPTGRQARGIARKIWAIAAACWIVAVVAVLLGGDVHGQHDFVLEESTMPWTWRLAVFVAAWLVMIGAMMLPSAVPLLDLFWTVSSRQPRPALARTALVVPYLAVWLGFAGLALAGDAVVHAAVDAWDWLAAREGLVLGTTLVLAGAFQFSDLKKACLTSCRSPLGMLWEYYDRGVRSAWRLGVRHALLCLGCCWALMLVMFATGTGSLIWMLLLTGVMVAEKTVSWGARIVTPTGIAFIASGLAIAAVALAVPH